MQTLTFTHKLLRQRSLFKFLIPLLAIFVGLGSSQSALAQSSFGTRSVLVNTGSGNTTYNALTNTPTGTPAPTGEFDERNFGSFDINTGQLILNGGTLSVNEADGDVFTQAFIDYRVFTGTISPVTGTTPASATGTIQLVETGFSAGVRTFSLTSAGRDILAAATTGGNGTNYRFDVDFRAVGTNDGDPKTLAPGVNRRSQFTVTGTRTPPTSFSGNQVLLDIDGVDPRTTNTTYDASATTAAPDFQGAFIGGATGYDINTGQLFLNGGTANTVESGGDVVSAVRLYYRVYKNGALSPTPFQNVALGGGGTVTNGQRTFTLTTAQVNLIAGLANTGSGNYIVDTYFEADVRKPNGSFALLRDDRGGAFYSAAFATTGIPIRTTTWTGNYNDDWFDDRNWDLGVPNEITNATVPDFGPGSSIYPNIYAGSSYLSTLRAGGTAQVTNDASGPAKCRNLFLNGGSQALRSICRLITGTLMVYGDFSNQQDSFIQREDATIEFAGVNQGITGGSSFKIVRISGGGTKRLFGSMFIEQSLTFVNGILTTDISDPTGSFVQLADRKTSNNNQGAQLTGETDAAYLRGFVTTTRANVEANEPNGARTFGNIGISLLFTGANNPGDVQVTRNTTESYVPLRNRYSIRRVFGVRPGSPNTNTGGLQATLTFRYLDSETRNLGPNGDQSIPERDLALFVSTNSGNSFGYLGRDGVVNETANSLVKSGVRTFATFTLGDINNPLPVRLTAFDAKRVGADALITWQTATEENSKGYDVQVSTNGTEFRTLASVPSANPNTMKLTSYSYLDTEKNKTGARYYRLRQVDLDGKQTFFAPVTVSFEGKVAETALVAYPNPFNSFDQLHVALKSSTGGKGQLRISDMTGRTIRQETVNLTAGLTDLTVNGLSELKAGIYVVNLTLATGEVKNLKVVKQ